MSYTKQCGVFCPDAGYCANRNDRTCEGFSPMNDDGLDEDNDPMEQRLERATY